MRTIPMLTVIGFISIAHKCPGYAFKFGDDTSQICKQGGYSFKGSELMVTPALDPVYLMPCLCDLQNQGGGWIVIQRRSSTNFPLVGVSMDQYFYGYGMDWERTNFWWGMKKIQRLISVKGPWDLHIEFLSESNTEYQLKYSSFNMDDETTGYATSFGKNLLENYPNSCELRAIAYPPEYQAEGDYPYVTSNGTEVIHDQFMTQHFTIRRCPFDKALGGQYYNRCQVALFNNRDDFIYVSCNGVTASISDISTFVSMKIRQRPDLWP